MSESFRSFIFHLVSINWEPITGHAWHGAAVESAQGVIRMSSTELIILI